MNETPKEHISPIAILYSISEELRVYLYNAMQENQN